MARLKVRRATGGALLVAGLLLVVEPTPAPAATAVSVRANPTAGTNLVDGGRFAGRVLAMVEAGGRLFLGGDFTGVRPAAADGGVFDVATGAAKAGFPRLGDGHIRAAVADGAGGWYVAGTFTMIEGEGRAGVARILADGGLGPWNPRVSPPGTVKALAGSPSGTIFLGGEFTALGGHDRPGVAAVDGESGDAVAGFVPAVRGAVRTLALSPDGGRLYVGGRVEVAGGQVRRGLAALESATGEAAAWDPGVVGRVDALAVAPADGTVYAGGDFSRAGGAPRDNLVRLDPATASAGDWGPGTGGPVSSLALSSDTGRLFVGGDFPTVGGEPRSRLAALDAASGTVVPGWAPSADGPVHALALSDDGSRLFAGGTFAMLAGAAYPGLAALDPSSGAVAAGWLPDGGGEIDALSVSGGRVLAGGRFTDVALRPRSHLAALDVSTGAVSEVVADADAVVRSLALGPDGTSIYAGGEFRSIGGVGRTGVARIDAATGAVDGAFVPDEPNGPVRAVALSPDGSRLYIGGRFDAVTTATGVHPRPAHLAALDARTGALVEEWAPPQDGGGAYTGQTGRPTAGAVAEVNTMLVSGDGTRVYAGGTFLDIGGRAGLVSLDAATGAPTAWQPEMDRPVNSLAESPADGRTVYVATGGFGGTVQAFEPSAGEEPLWERQTDGDSMAVAASATTVYLGGHFDYVCDSCGSTGGPSDPYRRHIAAFDAASGELDGWAPTANTKTGPYSATVGAGHVYIGGEFTRINDLSQPGVAQFPGPP